MPATTEYPAPPPKPATGLRRIFARIAWFFVVLFDFWTAGTVVDIKGIAGDSVKTRLGLSDLPPSNPGRYGWTDDRLKRAAQSGVPPLRVRIAYFLVFIFGPAAILDLFFGTWALDRLSPSVSPVVVSLLWLPGAFTMALAAAYGIYTIEWYGDAVKKARRAGVLE